ncbi:MAG: O-antigen ligase family protein [Bacteroidia bacterium]
MVNPQEIFPVKSKPIHKTLLVLLAIVAFTLPFKDAFLVNLFIVFAIVVWLVSNPFRNLFSKRKHYGSLIAVVVFYLLHLFSFLYTSNVQETFINLETKISLLFFPLIFFSSDFTAKQTNFFVRNFIAGCLLCCVLCLGHSTYVSITESRNYFFYQDLSWFQHPSYLSMYLTFCSVALFHQELYSKKVRLALALFFSVFVVMLSSKAGIVIQAVFLAAWFVSEFAANGNYKKLLIFSGSAVAILLAAILFVPQVKDRFQNVVWAFGAKEVDKNATESTAVRMLIWSEAKELIKEHPLLGVSPGDANTSLYTRYEQNGLTGAFTKKLNAHSEYFQTGVGLGILGLLSLLNILFLPLRQNKNKLLVFLLLIAAVNFITESMLQTMAGCIFFGYFYGMLCYEKDPTNS